MLGLAATAVLLLAAWLTREGVKAQAAYDARKIARRPALPRKLLGAVLTGVGLVIGGLAMPAGVITLVLIGIAGAVLHLGAFGLDPLADKGMEGVDSFQIDRVARAVNEAEKTWPAMKDAILRAKDRSLEVRVEKFADAAGAICSAGRSRSGRSDGGAQVSVGLSDGRARRDGEVRRCLCAEPRRPAPRRL